MADINITWILACNMLIQVPRIYNEVLNKDSVLASLVKSVKSDPNSVKLSQKLCKQSRTYAKKQYSWSKLAPLSSSNKLPDWSRIPVIYNKFSCVNIIIIIQARYCKMSITPAFW